MRSITTKLVKEEYALPLAQGSIYVGTLVVIDEDGCPFVTFPGNSNGVVKARTVVQAIDRRAGEVIAPLDVLLFFERGDLSLPIIIGLVSDRFDAVSKIETAIPQVLQSYAIAANGKRLQLEASDEIVLKCGKGSITLRADGRILIKGTELASRSSGTNKIKGASVSIN